MVVLAKANKIKNLMVSKLGQYFGFPKADAGLIYELFIECLLEVWKENPILKVPKIGTFTYKLYSGKMRTDFQANDYCRIRIKGQNWEDFVESKYKHRGEF